VSLPERHYDLAGRLLAAAIEESDRSGERPSAILARRAHGEGEALGESTKAGRRDGDSPDLVLLALDEHGFEPRPDGPDVLLGNCPFHNLARTHTELVCGMNLGLLNGLLRGLGRTDTQAELDPAPGRCCVRLTPTTARRP
jgi:predicted ArsR family transcriptional regulator